MEYVYMVLNVIWPILLTVAFLAGWVMTLFALPGTWLMVGSAALYAWLVPDERWFDIAWPWVAALVVLAGLGELVEFVAGALGVKQFGGSKRGALLAMFGSVIGAILGGIIGFPIPVIGPVAAIIVVGGAGALVGAMAGEAWKGRTLKESWKIGQGAFWGRLAGSFAKLAIATAMLVVGLLSMPL